MTLEPPTLLLSARYTEDSQRLWEAAVRRGWQTERLHGWRVPEHLLRAREPVFYLEVLMAQTVAERFGLELPEAPQDWLPSLPERYRRRDVQLTTLGEARRAPLPAFVKPPNDKSFPARIYDAGELPDAYPDETPVLVAEPVRWEKEFRCFILDRRLRTCSVYLRDGQLQRDAGFPAEEAELAELRGALEPLLDDPRVALPRAATLDLGLIAGRGWAVVEQNAAWGAGIYGCDPDEVLEVLRHTAAPLRKEGL